MIEVEEASVVLDCILQMVENRGLQFMLGKDTRPYYQKYIQKPKEYKEYIRSLVKHK